MWVVEKLKVTIAISLSNIIRRNVILFYIQWMTIWLQPSDSCSILSYVALYNNEMVQPRIDDSLDEARDRCFLRTVTHFWCATFLSAGILRGFLEEKYRRFGSLSRDTIVLDSSWDDQVVASSSSSF